MWLQIVGSDHTVGEAVAEVDGKILTLSLPLDWLIVFSKVVEHGDSQHCEEKPYPDNGTSTLILPKVGVLSE
jgi:hypothetical protein